MECLLALMAKKIEEIFQNKRRGEIVGRQEGKNMFYLP